MTTMRPLPDASSRYTAKGSAKTVAASGNETPCLTRFDAALPESHSKSPSTTVATGQVWATAHPAVNLGGAAGCRGVATSRAASPSWRARVSRLTGWRDKVRTAHGVSPFGEEPDELERDLENAREAHR